MSLGSYAGFAARLAVSVSLAALVWTALPAYAAEDASAAESSKVIYDQEFFARYNVSTADDMLRRIPGVAAILDAADIPGSGQQGRGFGSGGDQILINGKRQDGKTNQITAELHRIQSSNVLRVELIRGTSSEIDVLSEGLVVNIVLKEEAGNARAGTWKLDSRFDDMGMFAVDGLVSQSGNIGKLTYLASIERNVWSPKGLVANEWSNRIRDERYFYPNGTAQELRDQDWSRMHHKVIATSNLAYKFDNGDQLRWSGYFEPLHVIEDDITPFTRYSVTGTPTLTATDVHQRDMPKRLRWDTSAGYVKSLGEGKLNLLAIFSQSRNPNIEFRNQVTGIATTEISRNNTRQISDELIGRGSYTWPVAKGQTLELGLEGAQNVLNQDIRVFLDQDLNGKVEEVNIPTSHARVQELRGEAFANHHWAIAEGLTLESSLNVEVSEISNNYPFSPSRRYVYPKPREDIRYNLTKTDQVRAKIERTVSQLPFSSFVPTFDFVDNEIDAGNPDLRPEKAWKFEVGYEHRLSGDQGVIQGRAFYNAIQDHLDKFILRTDSRGNYVSAVGNIGDAKFYGAEVKAGFRLAWIGLPDVVVDARVLRQFSSTIDPFLGVKRTIKTPWKSEEDLGFRHDVAAWDLSYGITYADTGGDLYTSDVKVQTFYSKGARVDAFVERKLFAGMTLRAEAWGLFRNKEYQSRIVYTKSVMDGAILRTEHWKETRARRFIVGVHGSF